MLLIEPELKQAYRELGDDHLARLPEVAYGGIWPLQIALVKKIRQPYNGLIFSPRTPSNWTLRAAIGGFQLPVAGRFTISTSAQITAQPTDEEIELALNDIAAIDTAGGVTVSGSEGFFVITWNNVGARSLLTGDASDLIPVSILEFQEAVAGDGSTREVQTLRILQNVGALVTLAADSAPTTITVTVLTQGDSTHNHKIRVTLPDNLWGGDWTFTVNSNTSGLIGFDWNAARVQIAMAAITGVGTGQVAVTQDSETSYVVILQGTLANTAVAGIGASGTGLSVLQSYSGNLDMTGPGMEFLLDGQPSAVNRLEIEWNDGAGADPQKILGRDILIVRPVITPDSSLPGDATSTTDPQTLAGITSFTGSTASDLPSVTTVGKTAGTGVPYFIRLDGQFVPVYLDTGTADVSDPGQVNPLDYDADDNDVHWARGG